jgi:glycosyltransferase involved in cell wall biosynthesis
MALVTLRRPAGESSAGPRPHVVQLVPNLVGGGAEAVVRSLCSALPAEGIDVTAVTIYGSGLDTPGRAALGSELVEVGRRNRRDLGYFPRLLRALRELRPDVVHAHLHTGQYAGRLAALLADVPQVVFTAHGDEPQSALRRIADRVLDARTARFIVFTEAQRRNFARERHVPIARIDVIPNGVLQATQIGDRAATRAALNVPASAFALYAIGRFEPAKNHRLAIESLALLHGRDTPDDVHLILAGTGSLECELRTLVRELGLAERVHFLGFRPDAAALAGAMDLFVMTSRNERMPLALGEAMLGGLIPVITPWAGVGDFVADGRTGFVAADHSAAAFANAIRRARSARESGSDVAGNARAFAMEQFSFDAMLRRHAALYRALAGVST